MSTCTIDCGACGLYGCDHHARGQAAAIAVEAPAAPIETVTPIQPTEALRLGRLIRPTEAPYWLFGEGTEACALGAMALGWGFDAPSGLLNDETEAWEFLRPRLESYGLSDTEITSRFDHRSHDSRGDAAVLAFLAERGL